MKECVYTSANIVCPINGGKIAAGIEVIVVLSEPQYTVTDTEKDGVAELDRVRTTESIRFVTTADGAREMAKSLNHYADEAEQQLAEAVLEMMKNAKAAAKKSKQPGLPMEPAKEG